MSSEATVPPAAPGAPLWRRALPFVVAVGLIAFVLRNVDLRAFAARLAGVSAPGFLGFTVVFLIALLTADAFATAFVYRRTALPVGFREFWVLRGASYLPSLLNHHVGQAFITYFVARRHGAPLARVAGATLLVYASWSGCVLGLGCVALWLTGRPLIWLAIALGAGLAYLGLLALRPARLARTRLLGPLFEAGVSGHLVAMAVRLPHLAVLFLGTWLPFRFFGVQIPLSAALTYVPILMVAVTLPVTPQGFGTRDVLAATFFEPFAPGDTHAERLAALAAATTSFGVALTLLEALLGLILLRRAMPALERGQA
jgi:hypothetical protein